MYGHLLRLTDLGPCFIVPTLLIGDYFDSHADPNGPLGKMLQVGLGQIVLKNVVLEYNRSIGDVNLDES